MSLSLCVQFQLVIILMEKIHSRILFIVFNLITLYTHTPYRIRAKKIEIENQNGMQSLFIYILVILNDHYIYNTLNSIRLKVIELFSVSYFFSSFLEFVHFHCLHLWILYEEIKKRYERTKREAFWVQSSPIKIQLEWICFASLRSRWRPMSCWFFGFFLLQMTPFLP